MKNGLATFEAPELSRGANWRLYEAPRRLHSALAEAATLQRAMSAYDAEQERIAGERAVMRSVARTKFFRDGTAKDKPKHHAVAVHYAWEAYRACKSLPRPKSAELRNNPLIARIRLREIERIIRSRYGVILPNNSIGREFLRVGAHHIVHLGRDATRHIICWASLYAPWLAASKAAELAESVIAKPLEFSADTLGGRFRLSYGERAALSVTTIGSFDANKKARRQLRLFRRAEADRQRRRKKGALPREQYEAQSKTKMQPWVALGMSRATWYRRGMPTPPIEGTDARWEDILPNGRIEEGKTAAETTARPAGRDNTYVDRTVVSGRTPAGAARLLAVRGDNPPVARALAASSGAASNRTSVTADRPPASEHPPLEALGHGHKKSDQRS